ncbi:MAG TPA: YtxH domain-containing protein [Microthrixaceae bacterium]|nr:YtxH domain-containing protein [Microthrixaceae bacterium]
MRNVWKGLVIGSFAGAAVGVVLDVFERVGSGTHRAAEHAKEQGAELAEHAKEKGAELAEHAKEKGAEYAEHAKEKGAEYAEHLKEQAPRVVESVRGATANDHIGR